MGSAKGLPELQEFRRALCDPDFAFSKTLAFIDEHFEYTPKPFVNGGVPSDAGANAGSCKLLSLGKIVGLCELELLTAFVNTTVKCVAIQMGVRMGTFAPSLSTGGMESNSQ